MRRFHLVLFGLCAMFSFLGCGEKVPEGFPKTVPCQITVTDGGSPIEGVSVGLIPDTPMNSLVMGGNTNSSGVADMRTLFGSYSGNGVPEGNYTVTLSKFNPVEMPTLTDDEYYKQTPQQQAARDKELKKKTEEARVVPEFFSGMKSPLKLKIESSGSKLEVDIKEHKK